MEYFSSRLTKVPPEGIFESFSITAHQELHTSLSSTRLDAKLAGAYTEIPAAVIATVM
jgi:hypothetical protein